jgi:hypothetical protein
MRCRAVYPQNEEQGIIPSPTCVVGAPHLLGLKFSDGVQQAESIHLELLGSPREARPDLNCRKIPISLTTRPLWGF